MYKLVYTNFAKLKMRSTGLYFVLCTILTVVLTQSTSPACDDIDTTACKLMVSQRPDLCSDITLAKSVCARFCKLCPVECYHCNATVMDYHLCNTTMLCPEGEVCMRKELKSFVDGHHEYQMTCEAKQICDGGSDLSIPFGKRGVKQRDISITCCAEDFCNYPGGPQPSSSSGCPKDIYFLVDGTSQVVHNEQTNLVSALLAIAKRLDIGMTENLVALYMYDQTLHEKIGLQQSTDEASLISNLQYVTLDGQGRGHDTDGAIQDLVNHALVPKAGDRSGFPDAVVLITDSRTAQLAHLSISQQRELQGASHDVIVLSVGSRLNTLWGGLAGLDGENTIATDKTHVIHVDNLHSLMNLVDSLAALLNKC